MPKQERSRSLALIYSGMYMGSVLGLAVSPHLIHTFSWPSVFFIFGGTGVMWYGLWSYNAASGPLEDPFITSAERDYIVANTAEQVREQPDGRAG